MALKREIGREFTVARAKSLLNGPAGWPRANPASRPGAFASAPSLENAP